MLWAALFTAPGFPPFPSFSGSFFLFRSAGGLVSVTLGRETAAGSMVDWSELLPGELVGRQAMDSALELSVALTETFSVSSMGGELKVGLPFPSDLA